MADILIVEDDKNAREALAKILTSAGHAVRTAENAEGGIRAIEEGDLDLLLCDLVLPGERDGMEVFRACRKTRPDAVAIMMTAFGSIELAVAAMKQGAYDFLEKPLNIEQVRMIVSRALERHDLSKENRRLRSQIEKRYSFGNLIGRGAVLQEIFAKIEQVAPAKASVLVLGESGTGKELIANAIHYNSPRAKRPFVKVNCASLPENLLESELFGHVKGAFTGATADRKGRFEVADTGTLFLDEVGDIPPSIQVKLLRFLQTGEFQRVGGSEPLRADVRLISATNVDLDTALADGRIREDFYYRIKVITIRVPPLRERPEDIPDLVEHFVAKACRENDRPPMRVGAETMRILRGFDWPGNVRQIENAIESAVVLTPIDPGDAKGGVLAPDRLPPEIRKGESGGRIIVPVGTSLDGIEKQAILRTLEEHGGNKTKAAKVLGIGVRTLYRKLESYGIGSGED